MSIPKGPSTTALPGSDAKIEVMAARARRRERTCHPDDAVLSDRHGYRPRAWGGILVPAAVVEEKGLGAIEVLEERDWAAHKRKRWPAEMVRRRCPEMRERERQRSRRRKQEVAARNEAARTNGSQEPQPVMHKVWI